MAPYAYDPNLQDDDENQGGASGASPVQLAGGSSTAEQSGGGGGAAPGSQDKKLNTGSGYQNLDKYLNTNQSQQFGQKVLGKVGDTLDTAKNNQMQASDQFKNQVQSANTTADS